MRNDPGKIKLFRWSEDLPPALWEDLAARDPGQASDATGADWNAGRYEIELFSTGYLVDPKARTVLRSDSSGKKVSFQAAMVLVTTLAKSLGVPPKGSMVVPQELVGGAMFFTGPHAVPTGPLCDKFGGNPAELIKAAGKLGAKAMDGADVALTLPGLPMIPFYVLLWGADEEFEARAVIGLDANAHHHLALDGIWAMCNILTARLTGGRENA